MTHTIDELLPCPFCGGKAELKEYPTVGTHYAVECTECHAASGLSITAGMHGAIRRWNTRTHAARNAPVTEKQIIGALKSCIDAHGTITKEYVSSAAKRVYGLLASTRPARDDLKETIFNAVKIELLHGMKGKTIEDATAADKRHVAGVSKNVTRAVESAIRPYLALEARNAPDIDAIKRVLVNRFERFNPPDTANLIASDIFEEIRPYLTPEARNAVGDDEILSVIAEQQANGWEYGTHPREKARIVLEALRAAGYVVKGE